MFYITAFIATQEQVKPELKNEKSDTIAQGRQVKTSNPAKAAAMQNAHFASVSKQPAYDGQCIAGKRMVNKHQSGEDFRPRKESVVKMEGLGERPRWHRKERRIQRSYDLGFCEWRF